MSLAVVCLGDAMRGSLCLIGDIIDRVKLPFHEHDTLEWSKHKQVSIENCIYFSWVLIICIYKNKLQMYNCTIYPDAAFHFVFF